MIKDKGEVLCDRVQAQTDVKGGKIQGCAIDGEIIMGKSPHLKGTSKIGHRVCNAGEDIATLAITGGRAPGDSVGASGRRKKTPKNWRSPF